MKFSSVLLIFASSLIVGCAGSNPIAPDSTAVSNARVTTASTSQAFFPPIDPPEISCPNDAPQIRVGSLNQRMDIEFSEVKGAYSYEIEIVDYFGAKVRLEVPAPAHRAEWRGPISLYRVRVRTINCSGRGNWSEEVIHALDDGRPEPPAPPQSPVPPRVEPPGPQCMSACEPPSPPEPPEPEPQCMLGCF